MGQLILPAGGLAELRRAIEETATRDAVRALREAGRRLAADAESTAVERAGRPLPAIPLDAFWTELRRYFEESGWGRLHHEEVTGGVGSVLSDDWAEADPTESRGAPGCHITTGLLAEVLSRAVGQPVAVLEVACRSRGDDVCRFLFGSPTALLLVHKKLASTGNFEEAINTLS